MSPKNKSTPHADPDIDSNDRIGIYQMYRYSDSKEIVLLIFGVVFACINGVCLPVSVVVLGEIATCFISQAQTTYYNISAASSQDIMQGCFANQDVFVQIRGMSTNFIWIGLVASVSEYLHIVLWKNAAESQISTIVKKFYHSILRQDITYFDSNGNTDIGTKFSTDLYNISEMLGDKTGELVKSVSQILSFYIVAVVRGWKLTLVIMAVYPIIIAICGLSLKVMKGINKAEAMSYSEAGATAEEVIGGITTVIAYGGQEKECKRYNEQLHKAASSATKRGLVIGAGTGALYAVIALLFPFSFWYGIKLINDGEPGFESGDVIVVFLCIMMGSSALTQLVPNIETLDIGRVAMTRIFSLIDRLPEIDAFSESGCVPTSFTGKIALKNVRFSYPSRPDITVLNGVDIEIQPGEHVVIVGSSGSGKSTIIELLQRFFDPNEGSICIDGEDIRYLNIEWLRENLGVVSQDAVLFSTTIKENIRFGRQSATEEEIVNAAKDAFAHNFIMNLPQGYETLVGEQGASLSGGQKQRIALARALVRNTKILLLDEALSALDNESEAIVQLALEKVQKGRTTLIISHRLSAVRNADYIIVLKEGCPVEQGTHMELLQEKGVYFQLVQDQLLQKDEELGDEVAKLQTKILLETGQNDGHSTSKPLQRRDKASGIVTKEEDDTEVTSKFSLKRVLRLNAKEGHLMICGCMMSIITGANPAVYGFLLSEFLRVFDESKDEQKERTKTLVGITCGVVIVVLLSRVIQALVFAISGQKLTMRLRQLAFQAIVHQDVVFFDDPRNRTGILTTRLSHDATLVQGVTGAKIGNVLDSVVTLGTTCVLAFVVSWKLTLVMLSFVPVLVMFGAIQERILNRLSKKEETLVEQSGQFIVESVYNMRTVASLGIEKCLYRQFAELVDRRARLTKKSIQVTGLLRGTSGSLMFFMLTAIFSYGAYLVRTEKLDFYLVYRVISVMSYGLTHLGRNATYQQDFNKARIGAARLFALIDHQPTKCAENTGCSDTLETFNRTLKFQGVSFHYKHRPHVDVINNLDLKIRPGETLALVGPSGSGKSTIISLIERFYDVSTGCMSFGRHDVRRFDLQWYRAQIGLVAQNSALFNASIAENIAYGDNRRNVPLDEIIAAARKAHIHQFVSSLPRGYDTSIGTNGVHLSGGQRQRLAIARALVRNPKILLLDEATSALDSENEKIVQDALEYAREGRTCIIVAHRLSTVNIADRIAIVKKGTITEIGTHAELTAKRGTFYRFRRLSSFNL